MMRDQKGIKSSLTSPKVEIFSLLCWKLLFHSTLFPKSASRISAELFNFRDISLSVSLNFIRLLRVVITPSEKTTRSNRMNFRLSFRSGILQNFSQMKRCPLHFSPTRDFSICLGTA